MDLNQLDEILSTQIKALADESISLDNKLFNRQVQKSKELANLAGKKIAITGQQLYANELGARIPVPGLGIEDGIIALPAARERMKRLV